MYRQYQRNITQNWQDCKTKIKELIKDKLKMNEPIEIDAVINYHQV